MTSDYRTGSARRSTEIARTRIVGLAMLAGTTAVGATAFGAPDAGAPAPSSGDAPASGPSLAPDAGQPDAQVAPPGSSTAANGGTPAPTPRIEPEVAPPPPPFEEHASTTRLPARLYFGILGAYFSGPSAYGSQGIGPQQSFRSDQVFSLPDAPAWGFTMGTFWGFWNKFLGAPGFGFGLSLSYWRSPLPDFDLAGQRIMDASFSLVSFDVQLHLLPVRNVPVSFYLNFGFGGTFVDNPLPIEGDGAGNLGFGLRYPFLSRLAVFADYRAVSVFSGECEAGRTRCGSRGGTVSDWFGLGTVGVAVTVF